MIASRPSRPSGPVSALAAMRPPGPIALWFGVLAPPAAWFLHLAVSYSLVRWVCFTGATWTLHLTTAVTLALAGAGGATAWWSLRELGWRPAPGSVVGPRTGMEAAPEPPGAAEAPEEHGGKAGNAGKARDAENPGDAGRRAGVAPGSGSEGRRDPARFLATWGLAFAVGFVALIALAGVPPFVLHACGP